MQRPLVGLEMAEPQTQNPNEDDFDLEAYLSYIDGEAIRFKEFLLDKVRGDKS